MSELIFKRKSALFDSLVAYKIYLDGSYIGSIGEEEELQIEVPNGEHNLQISGQFFLKSDKIFFHLKDSETVQITIRNNMKWWKNIWLIALTFLGVKYFLPFKFWWSYIAVFVFFFGFIHLLYYKGKYISLKMN